ncbi:hypothetical protein K474DRAFT_166884 [Panus rudis PR-1116 ss-1]|nr:hypothetical protein K474DRAFT_166884 [Panus rudis PR-1116 ss-1]
MGIARSLSPSPACPLLNCPASRRTLLALADLHSRVPSLPPPFSRASPSQIRRLSLSGPVRTVAPQRPLSLRINLQRATHCSRWPPRDYPGDPLARDKLDKLPCSRSRTANSRTRVLPVLLPPPVFCSAVFFLPAGDQSACPAASLALSHIPNDTISCFFSVDRCSLRDARQQLSRARQMTGLKAPRENTQGFQRGTEKGLFQDTRNSPPILSPVLCHALHPGICHFASTLDGAMHGDNRDATRLCILYHCLRSTASRGFAHKDSPPALEWA